MKEFQFPMIRGTWSLAFGPTCTSPDQASDPQICFTKSDAKYKRSLV